MDTYFQNMYDGFMKDIQALKAQEPYVINQAKKSITCGISAMTALRDYVRENSFETEHEEINFFKEVKPKFHSQLVYWMHILCMELHRPTGGKEIKQKYFDDQLLTLQLRFSNMITFFYYYRNGETIMDKQYFLRKNNIGNMQNPHSVDIDLNFSTSHDYVVTRLLADSMLQDYLQREILKIDSYANEVNQNAEVLSQLQWTASKAGLVELIYAFQSCGVFNNGNASLKEIATSFEKIFGTELRNYYHIFNEIRLRKKSRSHMIDQLKERLILKMNELDERE